MNDILAWLTQTVGVGTVAGFVYAGVTWARQRHEQRLTFSAWLRAGISEPTLRLVAHNRAPHPVFIQRVHLMGMEGDSLHFEPGTDGNVMEMLDPGPPLSRMVPRKTWEFPMSMPEGLPRRVTLHIVGYEGAPDRLRTWKVPAMVTNG